MGKDNESEVSVGLKPPVTDGLLQALVSIADDLGASSSVTVLVGGSMVTGKILPYGEWLQSTVDDLRSATGDEGGLIAAESFAKGLEEAAKEHSLEATKVKERLKGERSKPNFLHLKDVRMFVGPTLTEVYLPKLRLRLSSIDGFIWGEATLRDE